MPQNPRAKCVSIDSGDRAGVLRRRDALVEEHLELARVIARQIAATLPKSFELDDLISTAYLGLLRAATNYDPRRHGDCPFTAYARPVIRGAVLDSVRRGKYHENTRPSITEMPESSVTPDMEGELDRARRGVEVRRAMGELGEKHRNVVDWHYNEELHLPEVGRRLGVGKSRASQLHCEAVRELRGQLVGV